MFPTIEANEVQPQNMAVAVPDILYYPHMNGKQTVNKRRLFWNIENMHIDIKFCHVFPY